MITINAGKIKGITGETNLGSFYTHYNGGMITINAGKIKGSTGETNLGSFCERTTHGIFHKT